MGDILDVEWSTVGSVIGMITIEGPIEASSNGEGGIGEVLNTPGNGRDEREKEERVMKPQRLYEYLLSS